MGNGNLRKKRLERYRPDLAAAPGRLHRGVTPPTPARLTGPATEATRGGPVGLGESVRQPARWPSRRGLQCEAWAGGVTRLPLSRSTRRSGCGRGNVDAGGGKRQGAGAYCRPAVAGSTAPSDGHEPGTQNCDHGNGHSTSSAATSRDIAVSMSPTKPGGYPPLRSDHQAAPPGVQSQPASGGAAPRMNSVGSKMPRRARSQMWKVAHVRSESSISNRYVSAASRLSPLRPACQILARSG